MSITGEDEVLFRDQGHSQCRRMRALVSPVVVRVWLSHSPQKDSQILTLIPSKV